jgi:hypothetical protein
MHLLRFLVHLRVGKEEFVLHGGQVGVTGGTVQRDAMKIRTY